jgi:hypothetical protein
VELCGQEAEKIVSRAPFLKSTGGTQARHGQGGETLAPYLFSYSQCILILHSWVKDLVVLLQPQKAKHYEKEIFSSVYRF